MMVCVNETVCNSGGITREEDQMSVYFEELDYRPTPIGALSLRRRRELSLGVDVFEIKLGDEYLMSSLFTASEIALARLGIAEAARAQSWAQTRCRHRRSRPGLHSQGGTGA